MRSFRFWLLGFIILSLSLIQGSEAQALTLTERLSGRILLQVQSHGEAWYLDPVTKTRFFLGTPDGAFQLLRIKGLGIRHTDLIRYQASRFPIRMSGRILLDIDDHGKAYYILPTTLRSVRLGNAEETYQVLREQGLGIADGDLGRIPMAMVQFPISSPLQSPVVSLPITPPAATQTAITDANLLRTFTLINEHRQSIGLPALVWSQEVADVSRIHSENMAAGRVAFGHDGFDARFAALQSRLNISRMGENVAANTYPDSVATAVTGWLQSPGHRANIENSQYTHTGIGIATAPDGNVFFTQIFVK